MTISSVDGTVGRDSVPGSIVALGSLPDLDYADDFTLTTDATGTPEQWARALFGNEPNLGEKFIWRVLLGFRLTKGRSPDTVGGWRIGDRGEDWIRLDTASWFLTGNLVVRTGEGQVELATFLRYDRAVGRVVWPPLSAVHRRLVPGVLRDAATKVRARGPAA